jgi:hypothetical protein
MRGLTPYECNNGFDSSIQTQEANVLICDLDELLFDTLLLAGLDTGAITYFETL